MRADGAEGRDVQDVRRLAGNPAAPTLSSTAVFPARLIKEGRQHLPHPRRSRPGQGTSSTPGAFENATGLPRKEPNEPGGPTMATQLQTEHGIVRVPTGTWHVDPTHSSVAFEVKHMMIATVHGRFKEFEGTIEAAEEINNSRVYGKVKAASIDTNDETRDAHLRSADFLDVEKYLPRDHVRVDSHRAPRRTGVSDDGRPDDQGCHPSGRARRDRRGRRARSVGKRACRHSRPQADRLGRHRRGPDPKRPLRGNWTSCAGGKRHIATGARRTSSKGRR